MSETKTPVVFHLTTSFWWPVTVHVPKDGGTAEIAFEAHMRLLKDSELHPELADDMTVAEAIEADRAFIRDAIDDLRGIESPTAADVDALLEELIQFAPYRRAFVNAIQRAHSGNAARLGN